MYILIQLYEGVLGEVIAYDTKDKALKNYNQLRQEAKAGPGGIYVDEAHLYHLTPASASGIAYVDSFHIEDLLN